ncbi:hypothetical protein NKH77_24465 [Streptomyces sp. M19]
MPLVLLQAVTAAGWFRLNGMWPARQGIALAFLGGVAADAGLLATDRDNAPPCSSAPSASGCCWWSSCNCAATPRPTSGCTA